MQIITTLNAILTEKGISVLRFSKETGIPEGRVYKWLDAKTPAKPKSEDVEKIENWNQDCQAFGKSAIRQFGGNG